MLLTDLGHFDGIHPDCQSVAISSPSVTEYKMTFSKNAPVDAATDIASERNVDSMSVVTADIFGDDLTPLFSITRQILREDN